MNTTIRLGKEVVAPRGKGFEVCIKQTNPPLIEVISKRLNNRLINQSHKIFQIK